MSNEINNTCPRRVQCAPNVGAGRAQPIPATVADLLELLGTFEVQDQGQNYLVIFTRQGLCYRTKRQDGEWSLQWKGGDAEILELPVVRSDSVFSALAQKAAAYDQLLEDMKEWAAVLAQPYPGNGEDPAATSATETSCDIANAILLRVKHEQRTAKTMR